MTEGKLRIVFMGTPEFAVPTLKALLAGKDDLVAVITQPDRPKGRGRKLTAPPVKELALAAGLPVLQPSKIKGDDFLAELTALQADLFVVTAYGRILPGHILNLPRLGTINVHGSLLPKYRGAAPIQRALINGESETGITIMQMDEGMDTGDILLMESIAIDRDDTSLTLSGKMAEMGGRALLKALDLLRAGQLMATKQDDSLATLAPPLLKEEGLVDWTRPARDISCLVRGLDPWPTTYTMLAGKRLRLFAPEVVNAPLGEPEAPTEPGTLCRASANGLLVATGEGFLLVKEIQPEGSRRMTVDSYLRGHPLEVGLQFES